MTGALAAFFAVLFVAFRLQWLAACPGRFCLRRPAGLQTGAG